MKRHIKLILTAAAVFMLYAPSSQAGDVKGCCQDTPTGTNCGAPYEVLGKKTCGIGWYKAKCDKGHTNCKKGTWALKKPGFTTRQRTGPVSLR